jgi:hypothetical protein
MKKKIAIVGLAFALGAMTEAVMWWLWETAPKRHPGIPETIVGMPFWYTHYPICWFCAEKMGVLNYKIWIASIGIVTLVLSLIWLKILAWKSRCWKV